MERKTSLQSYCLRLDPDTYAQVQTASDNSGLNVREWISELIHRELGRKDAPGAFVSLRPPDFLIKRVREGVSHSGQLSLGEAMLKYIEGASHVSDEHAYLLWKVTLLLEDTPSLSEESLSRALAFSARKQTQAKAKKIRKSLIKILKDFTDSEWNAI